MDRKGKMAEVVEPQSITSLLPGVTKLAAHCPMAFDSSLLASDDASVLKEVEGKEVVEVTEDISAELLLAVRDEAAGTAPPNCLISAPCAANAVKSFLIVTSDALNWLASVSTRVWPLSLTHSTMRLRRSSTE